LAPAWNPAANADVVLPVYYHWEFSTGPAGDFEYLARKLRSPKKWKNDPAMAALLSSIGTSPMSVDDLINGNTPGLITTMEGALVPLSYQPGEAPQPTHATSLGVIVNTPASQVDNPVVDEPDGTVRRIARQDDALLMDLAVPAAVAEASIPLGSITVDGVSLTVNALKGRKMVQVSLIPFTLQHTTLGDRRVGDRVHLEGDTIGKYVAAWLARRGERS